MRFFCFLFLFLLASPVVVDGATVSMIDISNDSEAFSFRVASSFSCPSDEFKIMMKYIFSDGRVVKPDTRKINAIGIRDCAAGKSGYREEGPFVLRHDRRYPVERVEFYVIMHDKRKISLFSSRVPAAGERPPSETGESVMIPSTPQVEFRDDGMIIHDPFQYVWRYSFRDAFGRTYRDEDKDGFISFVGVGESEYRFKYSVEDEHLYLSARYPIYVRFGTYVSPGQFERCNTCQWFKEDRLLLPFSHDLEVMIDDPDLLDYQKERHYFNKRGKYLGNNIVAYPDFPGTLIVGDDNGNDYEFRIGDDLSVISINVPIWDEDEPLIPDDYFTAPDYGDVFPGNPDSPGGSCSCCDELAGLLTTLNQSVLNSGYKLDAIKGVSDQLLSAVSTNGYRLDSVKSAVDGVRSAVDAVKGSVDGVRNSVDALKSAVDGTNSRLDQVIDSLEPKGSYSIPQGDWGKMLDQNKPDILDQIPYIQDGNVYFSDPGQDSAVPGMPGQPTMEYPVYIGESFVSDDVLKRDDALDREDSMIKSPVMTPQDPMSRDSSLSKSPVLTRQQPFEKQTMQRDPVRQREQLDAEPVRDRSHFYDRWEVPRN